MSHKSTSRARSSDSMRDRRRARKAALPAGAEHRKKFAGTHAADDPKFLSGTTREVRKLVQEGLSLGVRIERGRSNRFKIFDSDGTVVGVLGTNQEAPRSLLNARAAIRRAANEAA